MPSNCIFADFCWRQYIEACTICKLAFIHKSKAINVCLKTRLPYSKTRTSRSGIIYLRVPIIQLFKEVSGNYNLLTMLWDLCASGLPKKGDVGVAHQHSLAC